MFERSRRLHPRGKNVCHYWRGPKSLEPCILAPLCPCICGLRQPLPPCVPRSSLLYQDWLLHWYLGPFHLHIPRAHWSGQRNRQGGAVSSGSGCYFPAPSRLQALDRLFLQPHRQDPILPCPPTMAYCSPAVDDSPLPTVAALLSP